MRPARVTGQICWSCFMTVRDPASRSECISQLSLKDACDWVISGALNPSCHGDDLGMVTNLMETNELHSKGSKNALNWEKCILNNFTSQCCLRMPRIRPWDGHEFDGNIWVTLRGLFVIVCSSLYNTNHLTLWRTFFLKKRSFNMHVWRKIL